MHFSPVVVRGATALWFLSACALWVTSARAECRPVPAGAQAGQRWIVASDRVHDRRRALEWQRCPLGTVSVRGECRGSARLLNHVEASRQARQLGPGWRLPTVDELIDLLALRCPHAVAGGKALPGLHELAEGKAKYWSRTPVRELPGLYYNVDFLDGGIDANTRGIAMGVRLVRDLPPQVPGRVMPR